jgi:hypothetical protein
MASGATLHSPMRLSANELRPAKVPILSDLIGNRDILPVTNVFVSARGVPARAFRATQFSVHGNLKVLAKRNAFLHQILQTAEV